MTRNQYLGADLSPILLAQTFEEFIAAVTTAFAQAAANNFPLRARRLATEVALTEPDLIGLQEVFDLQLNGMNVGPPFVDHLTETLDALAAKGQSYVVAATVVNTDITIPFDVNGDQVPELVRVVDRDVILVRKGIKFTKLAGDFTTGGLWGFQFQIRFRCRHFPPRSSLCLQRTAATTLSKRRRTRRSARLSPSEASSVWTPRFAGRSIAS
jgi:hypothetical protein